jgi:hypothetical protein
VATGGSDGWAIGVEAVPPLHPATSAASPRHAATEAARKNCLVKNESFWRDDLERRCHTKTRPVNAVASMMSSNGRFVRSRTIPLPKC